MKSVVYLLFLVALASACTPLHPQPLEEVLRCAGKNRGELEKVLSRYQKNPADSLKLRAAEFLILSMPGKYSEYFDAPWNDVAAVRLRWSSSSDKQRVLDAYRLGAPVRRDDLTYITAEYLISNIELAFRVWEETPWGKAVPFAIFCEEILPYRIDTEPLESWREKALASFADAYRSLLADTAMTTVKACERVNALLPRFRVDRDFPAMSFSQLMASTRGFCAEMTALAIFSMRALGIPVARDFTPKWPTMAVGHSWNSVYDGRGGHISFMGAETAPGQPHQATNLIKYKVYRQTFGRQTSLKASEADTPQLLQDLHMKDVSLEYASMADVATPALFQPAQPTEYAYLAVPVEGQWQPIAWGAADGASLRFSGVGVRQLYLPVYYAGGQQAPASYPIWVNENGRCEVLRTDSVQATVRLTAIARETDRYSRLMLHGRFEGANRGDFSDARLLYSIGEVKGDVYHEAGVSSTATYRYLRYLSPENGRCNVAELEFYDREGNLLRGEVIGTPASGEKMAIANAFDGDAATAVNVDDLTNAWVGLDLGTPVALGRISFLPRTLGCRIYRGHTYRLSYWSGQRWVALDEQVAEGHELEYPAPANALFQLQNVTMKKKGACFTIENGVQVWR